MMNKYVIKGNDIMKVNGIFDHMIKKFNLDKVIMVLFRLFDLLSQRIQSYDQFILLKNTLDEMISRVSLFKKFMII